MDKFQYGFLMAVLSFILANQLILMAGYTVFNMHPMYSDIVFFFIVVSMGTAMYYMTHDGFSWLNNQLSKKEKKEIHKMTPEKMKQIEETMDYIIEHYPNLTHKENTEGAAQ